MVSHILIRYKYFSNRSQSLINGNFTSATTPGQNEPESNCTLPNKPEQESHD